MKQYDPAEIEPKWQQVWEQSPLLYAAVDDDSSRAKYYVLVEFPYPSGEGLHTGHVRSYTAQDIVARRLRMMGKNVLYPMGWDAFGLPTENYAIKNKIRPQDATARNVATFKRQIKELGLSFDWTREINTTDPKYYKWTQWIFLQLLKNDLAYQAEIPINWCPKERIGLANEEVVGGVHERCGTPVEKKVLKQWMLRITAYADRLIEGLKTVDYLPQVAASQINWIGKSHGATVDFELNFTRNPEVNANRDPEGRKAHIPVYTTRLDTIFGATYLVLAPEHPWVQLAVDDQHDVLANKDEIKAYLKSVESRSELERQEEGKAKTGVELQGVVAINPATGEDIPMWVADYVLPNYGTGAIMAVPAHDTRDYEFAQKFGLPIRPVIEPVTGEPQDNPEYRQSIVALVRDPKKNKLLSINWGANQGGNLFIGGGLERGEDAEATARREVAEETGYKSLKLIGRTETIHHNYFAHSKNVARRIDVTGFYFELESDARDEQKLEHDEAGKFSVEWLTVAEADARVADPLHHYVLDKFVLDKTWTGEGILFNSSQFDGLTSAEAQAKICEWLAEKGLAKQSVQYKLHDWVFSRQHYWGEPIPVIHCAKCGVVPVPEKDLPVELPDVEAYEPTATGESPLAAIVDWVNVLCPKCSGPAKRETDTMPNWAGSSWYYLRYTDPQNDTRFADPDKLRYWLPVDLYNGGMEHTTLHLLYSRFWHQFLYDQGFVPTPEPYARRRSHGFILAPDGRKMSKSLGNVINPDDVIKKYGADALRLYEMFMGPYDQQIDWSDDKLAGVYRFLNRVWNLAMTYLEQSQPPAPTEQLLEGNAGTFEAEIDRAMHKTLKRIDEEIEKRSFNTMVSSLMEGVNVLLEPRNQALIMQEPHRDLRVRTLRMLTLILAPITPHLAEELWQLQGETESVHLASWPKYDPELVKDDLVTIVVQVNGKVRGERVMPVEDAQDEAELKAAALEAVTDYLKSHHAGAEPKKFITVPGRLVNIVI